METGPLKIGERFDRYDIHELLGKGGTAWVYAGYHPILQRKVAIKVTAGERADFKSCARREAKLLSRLHHPGIVQVFDAGVSEDGSLLFVVMELLEGRSLRDLLDAAGTLSVSETLEVGIQVCDAAQAAHEQGAIHRDLKPENVFIQSDNQVKVLDFGVARLIDSKTSSFELRGTPLYMAPEYIEHQQVDARGDVYALGLTLYECLVGEHPFLIGSTDTSLKEIGRKHRFEMPRPVAELGDVPASLSALIQRALAKSPDARPQTMQEFGEELRAIQGNRPQLKSVPGARHAPEPHVTPVHTARGALDGVVVVPVVFLALTLAFAGFAWLDARRQAPGLSPEAPSPGGQAATTDPGEEADRSDTPSARETALVALTPQVASSAVGSAEAGPAPEITKKKRKRKPAKPAQSAPPTASLWVPTLDSTNPR